MIYDLLLVEVLYLPEKIENGVILDGAGTLTLNGQLEAGWYQIFGSSITLAGTGITVCPQWWGGKGDGTTNDAVAIQSAVDAASAMTYKSLFFPVGSYLITAAIAISTNNLEIFGAGKEVATILSGYDGDMFQLDCRTAVYRWGTMRNLGFLRVSAEYSDTKAIHIRNGEIL